MGFGLVVGGMLFDLGEDFVEMMVKLLGDWSGAI